MTSEDTGEKFLQFEGNLFRVEVRSREYLAQPRVRVRIWGKLVPVLVTTKMGYPEHIYITADEFAAYLLRYAGHNVPAQLLEKENTNG